MSFHQILGIVFLAIISLMLNKKPQATELKRGQYIYNSSGCGSCHGIEDHTKTRAGANNLPMAGGRRIKTPYGVFHSPNITPDKVTGIGSWTFKEFRKSMTEGKAPDGMPYYPVFPYTSYIFLIKNVNNYNRGAVMPKLRGEYPCEKLALPSVFFGERQSCSK